MDISKTNNMDTIRKKYICLKCNFITLKLQDYKKHLTTKKHINTDKSVTLENKIIDFPFKCEICDASYKNNSGLWKHKKKCVSVSEEANENKDFTTNDELMKLLIKNNTDLINHNKKLQQEYVELQKKLFEMCKVKIEEQTTP